MKKKNALPIMFFGGLMLLLSLNVLGQHAMEEGQDANNEFAMIFGLLELPVLLWTIIFSFLTARNFRGGKFGKGMNLIAWGFLVMAVGHLHMQIEHHFGVNLFQAAFGEMIGAVTWYVALMVTWALSGTGFYQIYKMSK